jgi:hypothetical protein
MAEGLMVFAGLGEPLVPLGLGARMPEVLSWQHPASVASRSLGSHHLSMDPSWRSRVRCLAVLCVSYKVSINQN